MSGGLTGRMAVASGLLAFTIGAAFTVLLFSVADLRISGRLARHSEEVQAAANQLERLVIDLETGQRGFVITHQERPTKSASWRRGGTLRSPFPRQP
jgi:CHASE3 domain sensor protein